MTDATTINDAQTIAGGGTGMVLAGRYRVIRQLGHGGMGSVWLAEDMQLDNKPFAVKMLPSILVSNKRAYRQLKDEALVAMKLVHPNIVQIRAFEENNGNPFLVMDYIEGQTLDDYLADYDSRVERAEGEGFSRVERAERVEGVSGRDTRPSGVLPEEEVIRVLRPIAAALDYAHSKGVVHRDVKPGNVMIAKDGTPYILDFGIAREIQETLTRVTGKLSSGTLLYMSPEQLNGEQPTPAQDIYSFAAMVYECLKGEPPFVRGAIEDQIKNKIPEPLPNSPFKIEGVAEGRGSMTIAPSVMAGLAKKPEERPKSCTAVVGGDFNHVEQVERVEGDGGFSRVERAERVEEVGSRVPRDRDGRDARPHRGSRFGAAMTALAVVLVLVGGYFGWMKYDEGVKSRETEAARVEAERRAREKAARKAEQARIEAQERKAAEKRRAEEEAKRLAEEKRIAEQKRLAEEKHRAEEEAERKTKQEARERERRRNWRQEGREFTINQPYGLNLTMKWCPAGTFTMGSPATEEGRFDNETQHQVTLTKGFWMGETEVTQGQWKKLMDGETIVDLARKGLQDDTVYNIAGKQQTLREFWKMERYGDSMNRCGDLKDEIPVYHVNWSEAVEFCRRLTQRECAEGRIADGYEYRLPTESEWEYACRAGMSTALPNGQDIRILGQNNAPALDGIAWYGGNSSVGFVDKRGVDTSSWPEKQYPGGRAFVRAVKGKQPNNWGLYDMIGNVWEWCNDWYGEYGDGAVSDPTGASSGVFRVFRGGGCFDCARYSRPASRDRNASGFRDYFLGFRVALAPMVPEGYRKVIQEELQKANVVNRHEQYPDPEVNREIQSEKKAVASIQSESGTHGKVQLWEGGPYWAETNIGAEKPWEYGCYFWWGDTIGYKYENGAWVASDGSSSGFSFKAENTPTCGKSTSTLRSEGWIASEGVLAPEHDAAHVQWGNGWRMPTGQELNDLCNKCDWNWTAMNGVNGYAVRGRGGYASNSIFLPCAAWGLGTSFCHAGSYGYYWSSVPRPDYDSARSLSFNLGYINTYDYYYRRRGQSIRPVQEFTK